jgi:hypothetical protein
VRRLAESLQKRRAAWVFTVFSLTNSLSAISRFAQASGHGLEDVQLTRP